MTSLPEPEPSDRWAAFHNRSFTRYWLARFASHFAAQIQIVAVGWQVYDMTRDPLDLGLIGLSQFLPALLLVLVTGAVADRFRRRTIMALAIGVQAACSATLLAFAYAGLTSVVPIFAVLAVFGTARAFYGPAQQSLLPNLVPTSILASAIALNTLSMQAATIVGPVAGGMLYGLSAGAAYGTATSLFVAAAILILLIPRPQQRTLSEPPSWERMVAGFRYIWEKKIVLGAISLDLFAVLLGGATALLPVFARDILDVGPWGLGLLRAGPAIGAIAVGLYLATHPLRDHAGLVMFLFVGVFGIATVVFGLSTLAWLSIGALIVMGGADMVSVYVRQTLVQMWTPDHLRGRVNAVNGVFIGASNELGEFRAGVTATLIGAVPAVVIGGIGTVAVTLLWVRWFPDLRRARRLDGRV